MILDMLKKVLDRKDLTRSEMAQVMDEIMTGVSSPVQTGAFITALRMKGETIDEVTGAAEIMRKHATFIDAGANSIIDTCGTGGDGADTFNISTTSAFVAAGAGACVAKHGNRAVSSRCGSADVLAALGVKIDAPSYVMEQCLQEYGIGFLFAPCMHPAMKHAIGPRKELGIRTIFNMLGPLTNPAGATGQVLGVFSPELTEMFAEVLNGLGCRRAFIVHGLDGLDEITCCDNTRISELRDGTVKTYEFNPEYLIGTIHEPEDISGGDAEESAAITKAILEGKPGARADVVLLNAAAAITAAEITETIDEGFEAAKESISSGKALEKLNILIKESNEA